MVQMFMLHAQNNEKSSTRIPKKPSPKAQSEFWFKEDIFQVTTVEQSILRIPTGKKRRQIKLQRLQNVQIWEFGLLV